MSQILLDMLPHGILIRTLVTLCHKRKTGRRKEKTEVELSAELDANLKGVGVGCWEKCSSTLSSAELTVWGNNPM